MIRKIFYVGSVIVLLLIINGLAHSIYDLWTKRDVVSQARDNLEREKMKNQELKKEVAKANTQEFVEEEARNKLFLAKPDEKVVIIPVASKSAEKKELPKSNLKRWIDLFL